ncbi:hypothetical protein CVD25_21820 [Bacillus canaveralius]|uniref:Uncharacterized protein n=1 Tax=Bacillus canaveralius TaxID=1403243 RepID=A0A2N5GFK5_9BACI|nr:MULTISPECIES: DUF3862 domain-containing protein [Bacillus]PLR79539.1 hypothetical protein CU635_22740 [Bacillus canaveralius]PLR86226.1 hypothetical protein CVD23_07300 [Bacillus sp. V33-4]PLR89072.1 hypothetical protein CVD25_21820 [Bacillus canaveralius]RSK49208.1 DUF3862 domain-containing protein [Bacillus canaveralius]
MEKVKKPFYKRWWFWVIVVIVVGSIAANGGEEETAADNKKKTDAASTEVKKDESAPKEDAAEATAPQPESKAGVLDEAKFNQIQNGMTYEEVVGIIGGEGQVISESGEAGTEFHTVMYEWEADGGLGANANFMFQGGKLVNKAQMGVVERSDVTVTLDEFNEVQNGMSYEEVVSIIGGEGTILSESGEKGSDLYTVMYEYKGESGLGANANFMFQGNKLQNKAQFGLE